MPELAAGAETESAPRLEAASEEAVRVVVIDDDEAIRISCRRILEREGYAVEVFDRGADGLARVREDAPPLLLVDLKMPEMDGFQVLEEVRRTDPNVVVVVITGYATIATAVEAMKAGAYDFLPKPFTPDELRLVVERGLERERLRREKELAQRRFITFVSHQLKSPLVAVKQYLDVLTYTSADTLPPRAREWIGRSEERLAEALQLIHDWLALARVEQGGFAAPGASTVLSAEIPRLLAQQAAAAAGARVALTAEVAPDLPPVRGDALAVSTVLENLLANAIKYNRPGGSVRLTAVPAGAGVEIRVEDTGIGIPADRLPAVFDEFVRVRTPETAGIPGSGLGLTICRTIVRSLRGTIGAESREGAGTTFTVRLPSGTP
ncbi:MAG TPA: response regulator [Candidatus Polarisedimenticolaceae bacterium]|nr:response regulator [Candidatus Polarisedimenticolaceae bacterium]